jgi:hypothetical protein
MKDDLPKLLGEPVVVLLDALVTLHGSCCTSSQLSYPQLDPYRGSFEVGGGQVPFQRRGQARVCHHRRPGLKYDTLGRQ